MKTNLKYLFSLLLLCLSVTGAAQGRVTFRYDAAGNRIESKTIVMAVRAATASNEKEEEIPPFSETLGKKVITIFPNPTQGKLKVEVKNKAAEETIAIRLYDMKGRQILSRESHSSLVDLDITAQAAGVYIMRIVTGDERSDWKIIKK